MNHPESAASPENEAEAEARAAEAAEKAVEKAEKVNWLAELRGIALMLLGVLAFHSLVAKPFYIPSESMMPNLLVGDRLVVSKYPYGWSWVSASFHLLPRAGWRVMPATPEYGDIVIVVPPDRAEDYIKRVIALPGDTIALQNGQIILNGEPIPQVVEPSVQIPVDPNAPCSPYDYSGSLVRLPTGEDVCELPTYRETLPNGATYLIVDDTPQGLRDNMDPQAVPDGHVFLMGDNRDHSADSRASVFERGLGGPVPIADVGGRAEFITFSLDGTFGWNPATWFSAFRSGRAFASLRPPIAQGSMNDGGD